MFAQAMVLVASFRRGEGNSGSRHTMKKAKEYNRKSYVMFNEKTDKGVLVFGLNELLMSEGAPVLTEKVINKLSAAKTAIIVDLDDTRISSTRLNNDAYILR